MTSTAMMSQPPPGYQPEPNDTLVTPDTLRTAFALAMSAMYKAEVPLYGDLVRIVKQVNENEIHSPTEAERLTLERHGAIRLGTSEELQTVRRIFALVGMYPVGYYDLSVAGLPMHATCFRPINAASLQTNPFRVFTTILRPELLQSDAARNVALGLLEKRQIFTDELLEVLDIGEGQKNRLTHAQAEIFITQALRSFSWQSVAAATYSDYSLVKAEHPILADIACFRSAHINHLTPRTLDINKAQSAMIEAGMAVKSRIEGPPKRKWPILLRQTSFLALEEKIRFPLTHAFGENDHDILDNGLVQGSHKARFGEIEERGAAVTAKGRQLYDKLLGEGMALAAQSGGTPKATDEAMQEVFQQYPDEWNELRKQGLVYCEYQCTGKPIEGVRVAEDERSMSLLERLIEDGVIETKPITYEDFLPFSAAGIFQSNIQTNGRSASGEARSGVGQPRPDLVGYERALGCRVFSSDDLYMDMQEQSLEKCATELGLSSEDLQC
ncbi:hypothetical protein FQN52_005838 [Onygenales sp. PD_12]|nr:hypothetical protein FQN51_002904 [Onygenales sp. PD_10]KAK2789849.1 hypothetical protein FQN53_001212 [Emmonsiellopsis sp. PD_33]KAK2789875.1 hypothetical protein FQN52_005838 [Onygenales sp. PD_12]